VNSWRTSKYPGADYLVRTVVHAPDLGKGRDRLGWRGGSLIQVGFKEFLNLAGPLAPSDYSSLAGGRLHDVCTTYAFRRSLLSPALRPYIDPILKVGKGSI
jgi:hypothetical protein